MPVHATDIARLERVLRDVFGQAAVEIRPATDTAAGSDVLTEVRMPSQSVRLVIQVLDRPSRGRLLDAAHFMQRVAAAEPDRIHVLASSYFSAASQHLLRDEGAPFIDFAGNAWISAPGIHVDRRGFANPAPEARAERDVFSDKASIVVRVLMDRPGPLGVRQIADLSRRDDPAARLSPGYVSKVVAELERRAYVARRGDKILIRHPDELLHEWVISYRSRRKPPARSYYVPNPSLDDLMNRLAKAFDAHQADYVYTGHAGASLVDRFAEFDVIDVYVRDESLSNDVLVGLGGRRAERGGNVSISLPYYKVSAFFGCQRPDARKIASDLQLYLDLYDYPVRGREQAEHLYERRILPRFEQTGLL